MGRPNESVVGDPMHLAQWAFLALRRRVKGTFALVMRGDDGVELVDPHTQKMAGIEARNRDRIVGYYKAGKVVDVVDIREAIEETIRGMGRAA